MTETKHTPEPWDSHIADNAEVFHIAIEAEDERIADVYTEANARLIAAAPELLEALKALTLLIRNMNDLYSGNKAGLWLLGSGAFGDAEAAIRKAEGVNATKEREL